ncbi:hypothetical protein LP420_39860 [Massilia sp. B-10]|nr:hypothetical protein LP420_39860 [Massilia sp. B-10]
MLKQRNCGWHGNAGLEDATARIQVLSAANVAVFDTTEALGSLLPGATASVSTVFLIRAATLPVPTASSSACIPAVLPSPVPRPIWRSSLPRKCS